MDTIQERQLPHSTEAEEAVLGSILIDENVLTDVLDILPDERAFVSYKARHVYRAMLALWRSGKAIDMITLADSVRFDGPDDDDDNNSVMRYILSLLNASPSAYNAEAYAQIVADHYIRRQAIAVAGKIIKAAFDESIVVSDVVSLARRESVGIRVGSDNTVKSSGEFAGAYLDRFTHDVEHGVPEDAIIKTGLSDLDRLIGGLEKPFMHVLMGRPGHAKSAAAVGVALQAGRRKQRVLFISLEMSLEQLTGRFVSQMTGLPYESIRRHNRSKLSEEERGRVMAALGELSTLPIHLDETPALKPSQIQARLDRLSAEEKVDLLIVDHLHIGQPEKSTGNPVVELGDMAMDISNIAKRYGVASLVLAQMNRKIEDRLKKSPQMADVNGSGGIEAAAYCIIGQVWPIKFDPESLELDRKVIELHVLKHRDGPTGMVEVFIHPEQMRLADLRRESVWD